MESIIQGYKAQFLISKTQNKNFSVATVGAFLQSSPAEIPLLLCVFGDANFTQAPKNWVEPFLKESKLMPDFKPPWERIQKNLSGSAIRSTIVAFSVAVQAFETGFTATPTATPPTAAPPTAIPPTAIPPTAASPTAVTPTAVTPTAASPTAAANHTAPPTAAPPTATANHTAPPTADVSAASHDIAASAVLGAAAFTAFAVLL